MKELKKMMGLTFGVILLLSGCSVFGPPSPKAVAQQYVDDLKKGDIQAANALCVDPTNSVTANTTQDKTDTQMAEDMFKEANVQLGATQITGNAATVQATVDNVDMMKVFGDLMGKAMSSVFSGQGTRSTAAVMQDLDKAVTDPNAQRVTNSVVVNFSKVNGVWKISDQNSDFWKALFGGVTSLPAMNSN